MHAAQSSKLRLSFEWASSVGRMRCSAVDLEDDLAAWNALNRNVQPGDTHTEGKSERVISV